MLKILEGRKTYIGLVVALVGVLGVSDIISSEDVSAVLDKLFEVAGILLAAYGRWDAQRRAV